MKALKYKSLFYEQLEYPETAGDEHFIIGLRTPKFHLFKPKYIYQVDLNQSGVQTHWGVVKSSFFAEPDIEKWARRLLGVLITDYPIPMESFQVVKDLPTWTHPPEETLALELTKVPTIYRTLIESPQPPFIPPTTESYTREKHLLQLIRQLTRYSSRKIYPISIQVLFQPSRPGSTRTQKRNRKSGAKWVEDTYKLVQQQEGLMENTWGRKFGYWRISARILAVKRAQELLAVVNKVFAFKQVGARRCIKRHQAMAFGKTVGMSSLTLQTLVRMPTGDIFPRELLGSPTSGELGKHRHHHRTRPFPREGYIIGRDGDNRDICLSDEMLRSHTLIVGGTGSRKTSLGRFYAIEMLRNPANRLLILDYAGEYSQILEHVDSILLRPGSEDFPLGINFLDWSHTLGIDVFTAESWILKVLQTLVRGRSETEFTPKMEAMLRDIIRVELERRGTLFDLLSDLDTLRTNLIQVKQKLNKKKRNGLTLTKEEEITLKDSGNHDSTVEAIQNRLLDLYASPLRRVFFVRQTTVKVNDLLENNIIIDLSHLRHHEVSHDLIRLFTDFLLLYLSRGLSLRKKGLFQRRNIILIEEAQLVTPEILAKRTLADGTTSEEVIGTLGGFGLSLCFISAQPHRLSRAIMAGCQTKIIFGVQGGFEANLLADVLGVESAEITSLQPGECLVRSIGTGIVKARAITLQMSPEYEIRMLETIQKNNPPKLLAQSQQFYEFIEKQPVGLYSTLVETIEEHTETKKERTTTPCWAAHHCTICKKTPYIIDKASQVMMAFYKKRQREKIQAMIKLYPFDPLILFDDILEFLREDGVPNAELIAFCAHWRLLDKCFHDEVIHTNCQEFFKNKKTEIVDRFMENTEIQKIIDISSALFDTQTTFSFRDEFCEFCPLDRSLRNDFCIKYRQEALQQLNKDLVQRLKARYEMGYDLFLSTCFNLFNNPSFAYCLATTVLKGIKLTPKQHSVIMEQTKQFLLRATPIEKRKVQTLDEIDLNDVETINIETESRSKTRENESSSITPP